MSDERISDSKEIRNNVVISLLAASIVILLVIGGSYDFIALITIGLGSIFVLIEAVASVILKKQDLFIDVEKYMIIGKLQGAILPVLGMFLGSFAAAFSLPIPFGYYFFFATLIMVQLMYAINSTLNFIEKRKKSNSNSNSKTSTQNV